MLVFLPLAYLLFKFAVHAATASVNVFETSSTVTFSNNRLSFVFNKASTEIRTVSLDGFNLLGNGRLYYDCYCTPAGFHTPGLGNLTIIEDPDRQYAGIISTYIHPETLQFFQKSYWLKDGSETDIHTFTRLAYWNETVPFLRNLQELRSLFRPTSGIFTHLASGRDNWAPLPSSEAFASQIQVQDATWYLGNVPGDPYVSQYSDYFTKYTFADSWRGQKAHGMYADGTTTNGTSYGAWLVMNTIDTYFGGPTRSDLLVDGIVYDYIVSNHHGAGTPNITDGFDRTFGPVIFHFNSGSSLDDLLSEAQSLADSTLNAEFYDAIAPHVPGYVPTSGRGTFEASITLPDGAGNAIAILSMDGVDYQDNALDTKAYQYWVEIPEGGGEFLRIPRVKAGVYRLTVYADGIFGNFIQDGISVKAGETEVLNAVWEEENHGIELWRIGTPDKSSGEFRHGSAHDASKPLQPEEYRIYWGAYNFNEDFPSGVNFTIGESDVATDFNYVHWSRFGPTFEDNTTYVNNVNNWTINFYLSDDSLNFSNATIATFTVQLAGVNTRSGNTDVPNGDWSDLPLTYAFNSDNTLTFTVPHYHSSSCATRSAVQCYQVSHVFDFPGTWLHAGDNSLVLSLPYNAPVYVQYDALRLELSNE